MRTDFHIRPSRLYLGLMLALMYLPILFVIVYSFNASKQSAVWSGFTLDWYRELFRDRSMFEALRNSLVLGLLSSCAAGAVGTLAAVGLARAKLFGGEAMAFLSTLPIMAPEIILGMVFLAFFSLIGLPFGMLTLVIAHTAFSIPYVFLMVKARLAGLDKSLAEAAKDLGASEARAFWDITLPLILPAIVSGMLLAFAMSFDDVIISVFVTGVDTNTLPIKIYSQIKTGVTPKTNALCTLLFFAAAALGLLSAWAGSPRVQYKRTQ
ncbi:MAG: ABC transporter permease [Clostridiales bacterium]|jgi:spermidine/putrescine transport system permease protein|nr:ABC transporter permease [Clostridiales bacterium]